MLVENLRKSLPPNLGVLQRIMSLEQVAAELTDRSAAASWVGTTEKDQYCGTA